MQELYACTVSIGAFIARFVLAVIFITIATPLLWGCLTLFEPEVILFQAARIAGDRPYCIVISDKDKNSVEYKVAVSRSDLTYSALTTRLDWGGSGGPFAENYYALLIMKNPDEMRNWSKLRLNFQHDVVPTQTSIYRKDFNKLCAPAVEFAKSIRY